MRNDILMGRPGARGVNSYQGAPGQQPNSGSHWTRMRDDLQDELLRMAKEDQAARPAQADTGPVDERNVKRLKEIGADQGWPGRVSWAIRAPMRLG
jgi:hypothetical protein